MSPNHFVTRFVGFFIGVAFLGWAFAEFKRHAIVSGSRPLPGRIRPRCNHDNTYQWFRPRVKKLEDDAAYDPGHWMAATGKSLLWGEEIPIGKFFERTDVPTLHGAEPVLDAGPLTYADMRIPRDVTSAFVEELM